MSSLIPETKFAQGAATTGNQYPATSDLSYLSQSTATAIGSGSGAGGSSVSLTRSASQTIPSSAETTVLLSTVEAISDPSAIFALNTGTGMVTVGDAGLYLATGYLQFASSSGNIVAILTSTSGEFSRNYSPGAFVNVSTGAARTLAGGDSVRIDAFQDSGSPVAVTFARLLIWKIT